MFLMLLQFLILHIDKLVGKGLPVLLVIELIFSSLSYMTVLAVPMSVLVANLMVYGRLAETNEFTALKMAGVPATRIMLPSLALGLILTGVMFWFSNEILPEANLKARSLFIDIRMKKPGFDLKENTFYSGIEGYVFFVKRMDRETDSLYDVTLIQKAGLKRDFAIARSRAGHLRSETDQQTITLFLYDGTISRFMPERSGQPRKMEATVFSKYRISFDLSELAFSRSNPNKRMKSDRTMSYAALTAYIDSLHLETIQKDVEFSTSAGMLYTDVPEYHRPRQPIALFQMPQNRGIFDADSAISGNSVATGVFALAIQQYDLLFRAVRDGKRRAGDFVSHLANRKWQLQNKARYEVERQKKIALPVACLLFVLVGAPLGLLAKKGSLGHAAFISALLFTYYWITIIQGEKMADRLFISPVAGMWFGNLTIFAGGVALIWYIQLDGRWRWRRV